jgi:dTMP kinase
VSPLNGERDGFPSRREAAGAVLPGSAGVDAVTAVCEIFPDFARRERPFFFALFAMVVALYSDEEAATRVFDSTGPSRIRRSLFLLSKSPGSWYSLFRMAALTRFISLEGGEAVGKSTQIQRLATRLTGLGHKVLVTREPGGTPLGESIRHLLKHAPEGQGMTAHTELLLFLASRAELVRKVIIPALDHGVWVLSDRFLDSTTVYQGAGRRLPNEVVERVNAFAVGPNVPGLTLVLDLEPEAARERQILRSHPPGSGSFDRMEAEPIDFFERVRQGYHDVAAAHPQRVTIVSAAGTIDETADLVWKEVSRAFAL